MIGRASHELEMSWVHLRRPLKNEGKVKSEPLSCPAVLITASGLQGEQPLVNGTMWVREVGKLDL